MQKADRSRPRTAHRRFERIVVTLDGSETAESVVARVAPLREPGSPLHFVRVVPGPETDPASPREALEVLEAESYLAFMAAEAGGGSEFEVRRGAIVEEILDCAAALKSDLIALSPRAAEPVHQPALGSTAKHLILRAACPVFVLGSGTADAAPAAPARILVPLDGSAASEAGLKPARRIAAAAGAQILLLHVIETLWAAGDSVLAGEQEREVRRTRERFVELVADLKKDGVNARALLLRGDPTRTIRTQVERRAADLVCLATASRGALGRLVFGSVAQKLIGTLPVPVIATRHAGAPPAGAASRRQRPGSGSGRRKPR